MRLLLVEDDESIRTTLRGQLALAGHVVDEAADGIEALRRIDSAMYDAVICDWEMPRLDGTAMCRAVRAGPLGRSLYVIMLTGKTSAIAQADGYASGVDAFLTKPCEPSDLLAALRTASLINRMQMRRAS